MSDRELSEFKIAMNIFVVVDLLPTYHFNAIAGLVNHACGMKSALISRESMMIVRISFDSYCVRRSGLI